MTSVRDGAGVTAPVVRDSQSYYVPGVSETRAGVTTYLHSGLKDATAQTSAALAVTATRVYDAFGMVVSSTGTWKGPFGYGGEHGYQEDATGLQLLGHRYYDPSTGRFLTRDPVKDGRNWYGYCGNRPLNLVDPEGLTWYYDQATGNIYWDGGVEFGIPKYAGTGYAGAGEDRNRPDRQGVKEVKKGGVPFRGGPPPRGGYTLGEPSPVSPGGKHYQGGCTEMILDETNDMQVRDHLLIHDDGHRRGNGSTGSMVLSQPLRDKIARSRDRRLRVVDRSRFCGPFIPSTRMSHKWYGHG